MSGRQGELVVVAGLCLLLLVSIAFLTREQGSGAEEWLWGSSTYASTPVGARALYLWLDALEYDVGRLEGSKFVLSPEDDILWILGPPPQYQISSYDAEKIVRWVEAGGTLIWSNGLPDEELLTALDVEYRNFGLSARPVVPWFVHKDATYHMTFHFVPQEGSLPLLADEAGRIGAIQRQIGQGEVWLFASPDLFTNEGLKREQNVALIEGILNRFPTSTRMVFDEYHHGFGGESGMLALLREMRWVPWGWAFYYTLAVFGLWILLRGRSFGRPLPLPGENLRREAGEYVQSMAWLYRSAKQRVPILRHHRERLKRRTAERYRLPPIQDDRAFVSAVARLHPRLDQAALHGHLRRLERKQPSEKELVALARENDEWLQRLMDY